MSTQPPAAKPSATMTWVLVAGALVVAGFLGGYFVGHHTATSRIAFASRRALPGRPGFGTNPGFGRAGGSGSFGGNPGFGGPSFGGIAIGTITRVSGSTIYLRERDGTNLKVDTDSSTQLRLANGGGVSSLKAGATIFVRGTPAGTGVLKASGIFEPMTP